MPMIFIHWMLKLMKYPELLVFLILDWIKMYRNYPEDSDPETNPDAKKYDELTHQEVLEKDLKVMDSTAASICRDNKIMIHVFGLSEPENVIKAVCGEKIGTFIY